MSPAPGAGSKRRNLFLLAMAELLAMALWFSASAVVPQLSVAWKLEGAQEAWLTMGVQIGFVAGALLSALLNLPDRFDSRRLFAWSACGAACANALIPLLDAGLEIALVLRFLTGMGLAGVYPPGMKLMATWCKQDRGLGIGILVGALTFGSALPHLLNGLGWFGEGGMPPWKPLLLASSVSAGIAALIAAFLLRPGPHLGHSAPFHWRHLFRAFSHRPTRLANFGYLGHMWELYAMWAWAPFCLLESYKQAGWSLQGARIAGFGVIAIGAAGCVLAGVLADRFGRTAVTIGSLLLSGSCALAGGFFFGHPALLTAVFLVWGFAVVADSAQFSAAVSELSDPRYVGTALTVQTSLGFLLTLATIRIVPPLLEVLGWERVFMILAAGPVFGIASMLRLRRLPEASRMACGHR